MKSHLPYCSCQCLANSGTIFGWLSLRSPEQEAFQRSLYRNTLGSVEDTLSWNHYKICLFAVSKAQHFLPASKKLPQWSSYIYRENLVQVWKRGTERWTLWSVQWSHNVKLSHTGVGTEITHQLQVFTEGAEVPWAHSHLQCYMTTDDREGFRGQLWACWKKWSLVIPGRVWTPRSYLTLVQKRFSDLPAGGWQTSQI